jgi:hypothetical protein
MSSTTITIHTVGGGGKAADARSAPSRSGRDHAECPTERCSDKEPETALHKGGGAGRTARRGARGGCGTGCKSKPEWPRPGGLSLSHVPTGSNNDQSVQENVVVIKLLLLAVKHSEGVMFSSRLCNCYSSTLIDHILLTYAPNDGQSCYSIFYCANHGTVNWTGC